MVKIKTPSGDERLGIFLEALDKVREGLAPEKLFRKEPQFFVNQRLGTSNFIKEGILDCNTGRADNQLRSF